MEAGTRAGTAGVAGLLSSRRLLTLSLGGVGANPIRLSPKPLIGVWLVISVVHIQDPPYVQCIKLAIELRENREKKKE